MIKNINNKIMNSIVLIYCLIPLALISGSFLPDLFLSIIGIFFLFYSIKYKLWNNYSYNFVFLFISFYIYILLRSLFSIDPALSLEHSLFFFRYLFFILATIFLIKNYDNFIKYFSISLFITLLFVILDALVQFFFNYNTLGFENIGNHSLNGIFKDKEVLGFYLARLTPLSLGLLIFTIPKKKFTALFYSVFLFISFTVVFLTGDRSETALSIISCLIIFYSINEFKNTRLISSILLILLISISLFFSSDLKQKYIYNLSDKIKDGHFISWKHEAMLMSGYNMFNQKPIFGHGSKMFRVLCKDEKYMYNIPERNVGEISHGCSTHPHNIYLEILAENGIIGFSFIFFIFIYFSIKIFRNIILVFLNKSVSHDSSKICFMICVYINLIPMIPSMSFFNNWASVIYFLPLGFYLSNTRNINFEKDIK